jgi:hypothetical protein
MNDSSELHQLYGRMLECCDLERGIDSGQFTTLVEVLLAVRARALVINEELANEGVLRAIKLPQ